MSCPYCGSSLTLDVILSIAVMKILGIWCGIAGVALVVFGDQIDHTKSQVMWIWVGVFIVMGFVYFNREWPERDL